MIDQLLLGPRRVFFGGVAGDILGFGLTFVIPSPPLHDTSLILFTVLLETPSANTFENKKLWPSSN